VAADLELPPSAILFVDDDAGNVARPREAGFRAIQFMDREGFLVELNESL